MDSKATYKDSHTASGYGERYNKHYSAGYYAALFREIELPILRELWSELGKTRDSLLDFACGTGRITREAKPYFDRIVGVDISPEMLKCADGEGIEYKLQDIAKEPLGQRFGVVTAFRFFLNAEGDLRIQALRTIRNHLAEDGRLICNIHMNANSPMGLVYRFIGVTKVIPTHNTLSLRQFTDTLAKAGFSVERVIWYGTLPRPGRFFARFLDSAVGPIERFLTRAGLQSRFAHSFVIVAKVDDRAGDGGR